MFHLIPPYKILILVLILGVLNHGRAVMRPRAVHIIHPLTPMIMPGEPLKPHLGLKYPELVRQNHKDGYIDRVTNRVTEPLNVL